MRPREVEAGAVGTVLAVGWIERSETHPWVSALTRLYPSYASHAVGRQSFGDINSLRAARLASGLPSGRGIDSLIC